MPRGCCRLNMHGACCHAGDDPLVTCRKILCFKETLQFPPEAPHLTMAKVPLLAQPPRRPSAAPGARPLARGCPLGPREERPPRVDAEARQGRRRPGARPRVADSTGVGHPGSLRTPRASSARCCATARSDSARRVPSRSRGTPSSTASIGARFAAPTPRPSSPTSSRPRTRRTSTSSRSGRPTSRVPPLATRTVGFPTPTSLSWATSTSDTHRAPMLCSTPSASRPTETNRAPGARAQTGDPPGAPAAPPPR